MDGKEIKHLFMFNQAFRGSETAKIINVDFVANFQAHP
jgi:hypothetical protein